MEHQKAESFFTGYYENDLNDSDLRWLEKHLESCDECKKGWDQYNRAMNEISGLLNVEPPSDVIESVEKKINKRSRGKFFGRQKTGSIQFSLVSFILVLIFILAYLVLIAVNEIVMLDSVSSKVDTGQSSDSLIKQ